MPHKSDPIDQQEMKSPYIDQDNDMEGKFEKLGKIEQSLHEQVPELVEYADYISEKSNGEANFFMHSNVTLVDVYKDGEGSEYLGQFYSVTIGESWPDHRVTWYLFYVSEDFREILWKDRIRLKGSDFDIYTLEEWRTSGFYGANIVD